MGEAVGAVPACAFGIAIGPVPAAGATIASLASGTGGTTNTVAVFTVLADLVGDGIRILAR